MARVLIIGHGNPLRTDDGLGWRLAEELERAHPGAEVQILKCQQLDPELADELSRVEHVIFVHSTTNGPAGTIASREIRPVSNQGEAHYLDAPALLARAQELYGKCPQALVVSVTGECFGFGRELSPIVETSFPVVLNRVQMLIRLMRVGEAVPA